MKKQLTLSEKLKRYSLLTGGAMATALAGDAQIVYTDVVPDFVGSGSADYQIDLNNDGVFDFFLNEETSHDSNFFYCDSSGNMVGQFSLSDKLYAYANCSNCLVGNSSKIKKLSEGDTVSELEGWTGSHILRSYWFYSAWNDGCDGGDPTSSSSSGFAGNWLGAMDKYVGVRFFKDDHFYYGWVRLTVDSFSYTVKDYAFETIPDSAITAGNMGCGVFYMDIDDDDYGSMLDSGNTACVFVSDGLVSNNLDCDDLNPAINPISIESCNNLDDDCNGAIDDGVQNIYYADNDGDGYGDPYSSTLACLLPDGYVGNSGDCDDTHAEVHPLAPNINSQISLGGTSSDYAQSIQPTADGGYIVAGFSYSNDGDVSGNHGYGDTWIMKLDSMGAIEWQKSLGGTDDDWAQSIQPTADGGYIVAGGSWSNDGNVSGNHGYSDCWIVKLDGTGAIEWQISLGGTSSDYAQSVQPTADGGYIVAGSSYSNDGDVSGNHGLTDYWIMKLDGTGTIEWQKSLGGTSYDFAYSIQPTADGGYIVAGSSYSNDGDVSGNHGYDDYWIVKLDGTGAIEWQKSLGGTSSDEAQSIQQTADGGYIVAGYSESNDGDITGHHSYYDYWIVKLDGTGAIEWQQSLGGTKDDDAQSIQPTADDGYIVAGYSYSNDGDVSGHHGSSSYTDYWIVKLDGAGAIEWQKSLGGTSSDYAQSIQQTADGGYIVAGYSYSNNGDVSGNHGYYDYWIVKLNSSPGGIELCNSIDDNCNGSIDDGLVFTTYYADADVDLFGDANNSVSSCAPVSGYIADNTDCIDNDAAINPSATEICNNLDDNCNGAIDDGLVFTTYYADADGDTYGDANNSVSSCSPVSGYVTINTDCDDSNSSINPNGIEVCNNLDDNCNGSIDDGFVFTNYYADNDGDTYGDANNSVSSCTPVSGYVTDNTDCNDNNAAINPSAAEICNNVDDNCNGSIDDGLTFTTYYADADGDTYGDANNSASACAPVSGYVIDNTDCNDNNAAINPSATEICNNADDNCNGSIDDGLVFTTYYADNDADNFGDANNSVSSCAPVSGYVENNTDCNDNNEFINPLATEICNNADDNCNGSIDDGLVFTTYYADTDADNYGDPDNSEDACEPISNFVLDNTDCDDSNPNVNPAATEITNNNIDDDCDGYVDEFGVGVSSINTNTNQLSVFPNPTDGKFVIELELRDAITGEATIEVINLLGQIMQSQKVAMVKGKLQQEIQFSKEEAEGMYLVKVIISDEIFTAQIDFQK